MNNNYQTTAHLVICNSTEKHCIQLIIILVRSITFWAPLETFPFWFVLCAWFVFVFVHIDKHEFIIFS